MKKALKIIAIVLTVIILSAGAFIAWAIWPGSDEEIRARADAIPVPSSWELTYEKVTPPLNLCLEKAGCPSLERAWKLDRLYSSEELRAIFGQARVTLDMDARECRLSANGNSPVLCSGMGSLDNYWYNIYQSSSDRGKSYELTLYMKELHE